MVNSVPIKNWKDIIEKYPLLYQRCKYIECDFGWYNIIESLSSVLEKLIVKGSWSDDCTPYATQIKEKYGTLRFYMSIETDEMSSVILLAEKISAFTCEKCGNQGEIINSSWISVRCKDCRGE